MDKKDVTIAIEAPNDIVEYDSNTGTIKVRSRPSIPANLKLSIKNLAKESEQKFLDEIVSDTESVQRKVGVVATNITTLAPSPIFQLHDKFGLCKAKEERDQRVRGIILKYLFIF